MSDPHAGGVTLAFDTSGAACRAALLSGDDVVATRDEPMARGQAERLIPLLQKMLLAEGLGLSDVTLIGVGTGPGNFTGIRISVAAARGLALSLRVPAIGVSTLHALACGLPRPCMTVVAGRQGTVHVQMHGDGAEQAPRSLSLDDPAAWDMKRKVPICGDDAARVAALTGGAVLTEAAPHSVAIARIARARAATGAVMERPRPLYLRAADAPPARDHPPPTLPRATPP